MILQAEAATGLFSTVAQQGMVFTLLVGIIFVLAWVIVKREKYWKKEMEKLEDQIKAKDNKIDELHNENKDMALKNLEAFKDFIEQIKALRNA